MLVTYTAPNRAHHYAYATALARAGCLRAFVSGFSRFSPRAALPEVGDKLVRADHFQNIFLASHKLRVSGVISDELGYLSKIWMDHRSEKTARESDVFLFYNGAGLYTETRLATTNIVRIVEAVNSHVLVQERIIREEHVRLGVPFSGFHRREVARRVEEYESADAVLCPSEFVRQSFIDQGIPEDRLLKVTYGFTLQQSETRPLRDKEKFRVLYVGQISLRKGLRYLFQAFEQLRHPGKELWIVGPMTQRTGIEDLSIPAGACFLGVLKGDALARAYQGCDVFVLPTLEDGFALVMGEALSFGLPVIVTVHSGGADLFQDGVEGFLVPIRDPNSIAQKLQVLADDRDLLHQMSEAAGARAQALGGWETAGKMLVEALASVHKVHS